MDSDHGALDAICPPLSRTSDPELCRLNTCNVPELPDSAECPGVPTRPVQQELGISRLSTQDSAAFQQLPASLSADTTTQAQSVVAAHQMLATTPSLHGVSPLMTQVSLEAAHQAGTIVDDLSAVTQQLAFHAQQAASGNASADALLLKTSSGGKLLTGWQPERTQVGFAVQPQLSQPCSTGPIQQHSVPITVLATAEHCVQQQGLSKALSYPAPSVPRRSSSSSGGGGSDSCNSPAASLSKCHTAAAVSPGLQARIRAAELAAAGQCDPISWAAAEAEAIKADKEAAAAAARQAQEQHLQEELAKRKAAAARVAMQLAEAKEHFSGGAAEAAAEIAAAAQLRLQSQQPVAPLLQCHRQALPGRLVMTDPDSLHNTQAVKQQPAAVCAAEFDGGTIPATTANGMVPAVGQTPPSSPDVAVGASPSSHTSLPPPEFLLQDISLVVTSSLFEGSRGSSPQPHMALEPIQPQSTPPSATATQGNTAQAEDIVSEVGRLLGPAVNDRSVSHGDSNVAVACARESALQPSSASSPRPSPPKRLRLSVGKKHDSTRSNTGVADSKSTAADASEAVTASNTSADAAASKPGGVASRARSGSKLPPASKSQRQQQQPGARVKGQQHDASKRGEQQLTREPGSIFRSSISVTSRSAAAQPSKMAHPAVSAGSPVVLQVTSSRGTGAGTPGAPPQSPCFGTSGVSPRSPPTGASNVSPGQPHSRTCSAPLRSLGTGTAGASPRSPRSGTSSGPLLPDTGTVGVAPRLPDSVNACKSPNFCRSPFVGAAGVSAQHPNSATGARMSPKASVRPPWNCNIKAHARGGSNSNNSSTSGTPGVRSPLASPPVSPSRTPSPRFAASETSRLGAAVVGASRIPSLPGSSSAECVADDAKQAEAATDSPRQSSNQIQQVLGLSSDHPRSYVNLCSSSDNLAAAVAADSQTAADTDLRMMSTDACSKVDSSGVGSSEVEQQLPAVSKESGSYHDSMLKLPLCSQLLSSDDDCLLMPPELVVGRLTPRNSGTGFLGSADGVSRANSNLSSASSCLSHSSSGLIHAAVVGGQVCSRSMSVLGSCSGHAGDSVCTADTDGWHGAAEVSAPTALIEVHADSCSASETDALVACTEAATAEQATVASTSPSVASGVDAGSAAADSSFNCGQEQAQQQQQHVRHKALALTQRGTSTMTVCDDEPTHSGSESGSAADGAASGLPVSSTASGSSTIAGRSADNTVTANLDTLPEAATVQSLVDKHSFSELQQQQQQQQEVALMQLAEKQQQLETLGSAGVAQGAAAAGGGSGLSADLSADSAELLLSPLPYGAVPKKLMSRQSSEQSIHSQASDHNQQEVPTSLTEQQMHSPAQFLLSMSMSCSPHRVDTLESTVAYTAASKGRTQAAARDLQDASLAAVDGATDLLQKLAAGDEHLQQRQQEDLSDWQQQQQRRGVPGAVAGHQRLQQLIPQRPPPRQQQMPARILTWSGSGSPRTNSEQPAGAAATPAYDSKQPQLSARILSWSSCVAESSTANRAGETSASAAVPAPCGNNTASSLTSSYVQPPSSLPMTIARQGSDSFLGNRVALAVLHSSSSSHSRSVGGCDEGGGRHRGSNVLAALIQHDTSITSSFRSALLESLCSKDDGASHDVEQQRHLERGGRHMRRGPSGGNRQQHSTDLQADEQQQQVAHVVAFSFPRTSSLPAFGGRGSLAPSMSNSSWAIKAPPQQQSAAVTVSRSSIRQRMQSGDDTAQLTAADGAGSFLYAAPVLRLSRSSGNLQSLTAERSSIQRARPSCGLADLAFAGFSPISEGTNLTVTSSCSGEDPETEEPQQLQQHEVRASSRPAELAYEQQQHEQQQMLLSIQGCITQTSPPAAVLDGGKRQKGLLSVQMRRSSNTAAAEPMRSLRQSPVRTLPSVAAADSDNDIAAETRVRGGKGAAAALLGLGSVDSNHSAQQAQTPPQQQQQGSVKKYRVSWADVGTVSSSKDCVGSSAARSPAANSPRVYFGTAIYSTDAPTTPVSVDSPTAATAGLKGLTGLLVSAGPPSAGLPPVAPGKTPRRRNGLMRHSKSCMEFSSLTAGTAAVASEQQSPRSPVTAGQCNGVHPQQLSFGSEGKGGSSEGEQQQQQQVNVFIEAFASKKSSTGVAVSSRGPAAYDAAADGAECDSATYAAGVMTGSTAVAVPAGSRGASLNHSRSAPAEIGLLSCSWHEIEPLSEEQPAQSFNNNYNNNSSSSSRMDSRLMAQDPSSSQGLAGGIAAGPAVYSYAGDFYGVTRQRSSSFTSGCGVQQHLQEALQQRDLPPADAIAVNQQRQQPSAVGAGRDALLDLPSTQHAGQQQQQQQGKAARGWFGRLWPISKLSGAVRQRHVGQQQQQQSMSSVTSLPVGAVSAGSGADAEIDLSDLMLMGQLRCNESAMALRRVVDMLQQQSGGSAVERTHNE